VKLRRVSIPMLVALGIAVTFGVNAEEGQSETSRTIEFIDQSLLLSFLAGNKVFTLIDARSPEEYGAGHIVRAVNVPHDNVDAFAAVLPEDLEAPIVVYCRSGHRASALRDELLRKGHEDVRVLGPQQMIWADALPSFGRKRSLDRRRIGDERS